MNIIKKQRIKLGLTQKQLGKKIQLSQSYISEIETFKVVPSHNIIYKLGNTLNICPILIYRNYYCIFNYYYDNEKKSIERITKTVKEYNKICKKCKNDSLKNKERLIGELCKKLKTNQRYISRKIIISRSYVRKIKKHKQIPAPNMIFDIGEALNICPMLLFEKYYCDDSSNKCETCKKQKTVSVYLIDI